MLSFSISLLRYSSSEAIDSKLQNGDQSAADEAAL
jgi:hypothetical protein